MTRFFLATSESKNVQWVLDTTTKQETVVGYNRGWYDATWPILDGAPDLSGTNNTVVAVPDTFVLLCCCGGR